MGASPNRMAIALEAFRETLLAFCETMLPNGHRSGNKWICGDLEDGVGDSCAVFLDSGGFNDMNPSADHVKGGSMELWSAMFGVTDKTEIIVGMEAWVKDGTLPDGSRGVPIAGKIEVSDEQTVTAQDKYELERVKDIRTFQNWIEDTETHPETYANTDVPACIKHCERLIERRLSAIYAHRWSVVVENTQQIRDKLADELAQLRGLSTEVFRWLIDNGYIGATYSEAFDRFDIAFPVFRDIIWPPETTPELQFLGMHIPWTSADGAKHWKYEPKGCSAEPLIIGDPATTDLVVIGGSRRSYSQAYAASFLGSPLQPMNNCG